MKLVYYPEVGDGVTYDIGTDSYGATVIDVSPSKNRVTIQMDKSTLVEGSRQSDWQVYEFERNPEGSIYHFTRRKDGRYKLKGLRCGSISRGRSQYLDPSY